MEYIKNKNSTSYKEKYDIKDYMYLCRKEFTSQCGKQIVEGSAWKATESEELFCYALIHVFSKETVTISALMLACNFIRILDN